MVDAKGLVSKLSFAKLKERASSTFGLSEESEGRPSRLWGILREKKALIIPSEPIRRVQKAPPYMINPESMFNTYWHVFIMLLVMYTTTTIPYRVGFQKDTEGTQFIIESAIDLMFAIEIILNFRTGIIHPVSGQVRYEKQLIAKNYLKGSFIIDLLSTLPIDLLLQITGGQSNTIASTKLIRVTKLLRLMKLARLMKLRIIIDHLADRFSVSRSLLDVFKVAILVIFSSHLMACVWVYPTHFIEKSWASENGYNNPSLENQEELLYAVAMYWSMTTMTTVGYGDIVAVNTVERAISIFVMIVSVSLFGYVIGNISTLIENLDVSGRLRRDHMTRIREYVETRNLPRTACKKIRDHFEYYYQYKSVFNENAILENLPHTMKIEVIHYSMRRIIGNIQYLQQSHPELAALLAQHMHPCCAEKDEIIYGQNDIAIHIFFVIRGVVLLSKSLSDEVEDIVLGLEKTGGHFGELEMFHPKHAHGTRMCNATAKGFCELTFISRNDISTIARDWPDFDDYVTSISIQSAELMERRVRARKEYSPRALWGHNKDTLDERAQAQYQDSPEVKRAVAQSPRRKHNSGPIKAFFSDNVPSSKQQLRGRSSKVLPTIEASAVKSELSSRKIPAAVAEDESESTTSSKSPRVVSLDLDGAKQVTLQTSNLGLDTEATNAVEATDDLDPPKVALPESPNFRSAGSRFLETMPSFETSYSSRELDKQYEQLRNKFLLHPHARFRLYWDIALTIFIFYSTIVVPYRIGFDVDAVGEWQYFELCIDAFFFWDIIFTFRTAYFDDNRDLISDRRVIALRYMKGFFLVDVISTIPVDVISVYFMTDKNGVDTLRSAKLLKTLKITRLLKLARLMKVKKAITKIKDLIQLGQSTERLIGLVLFMLFVAHWNSCIAHWVMLAGEEENGATWCSEYFNVTSCSDGGSIALGDRYIAAMYWAFATMTTVGFGDVTAYKKSLNEVIAAIVSTLLNATVFGYVISEVMSVIANYNPTTREYSLQMNHMKDYVLDNNMQRHQSMGMIKHYEYLLGQTSLFPENEIFNCMKPQLRFEIARILTANSLMGIPLISTIEHQYKGFVSYAIFMLKPLLLMRGDHLCTTGCVGDRMYFLVHGSVEQAFSSTNFRVIDEAKPLLIEQYAMLAPRNDHYRVSCVVTPLALTNHFYSMSRNDFDSLRAVSPMLYRYFAYQIAISISNDEFIPLGEHERDISANFLQIGAEIQLPNSNLGTKQNIVDVALAKLKEVRNGSGGDGAAKRAKKQRRRSLVVDVDADPENGSSQRGSVLISQSPQVSSHRISSFSLRR